MKKQDIIISDDTLTKEQKEKLEQEFFERQQKELHKGRLFLTASVIALYANAVITAALYPLYLRNLLRSIFFIKDPKKPDDFALPESAIMFITVLIILIILCINIGMAIATNVCAVKKKRCKACGGCIVYTCRGHKSADNCNAVKLDSDLQRYSGRNCNVR